MRDSLCNLYDRRDSLFLLGENVLMAMDLSQAEMDHESMVHGALRDAIIVANQAAAASSMAAAVSQKDTEIATLISALALKEKENTRVARRRSRGGSIAEGETLVIFDQDITIGGKFMAVRVTLQRPNKVLIEEFALADKNRKKPLMTLKCNLAEAMTGPVPKTAIENKELFKRMCKRLSIKVIVRVTTTFGIFC